MASKTYSIIFGLTADPIHKGHEQAIISGVDYCRDQEIEIEQFLLVPVYQPNLIADKKAPEQRFKMCDLVAQRLSRQLDCIIEVSSIEKQLVESTAEKNYSFKTVKRLVDEVPVSAGMAKWLFMVSADHFCGRWPKFRQWYKWQELLQLCGLLINQRPGNSVNQSFIRQLKSINDTIFVVERDAVVAVSSSALRSNPALLNNTKLVAEDIVEYIQQQSLYRK